MLHHLRNEHQLVDADAAVMVKNDETDLANHEALLP